MCGLLQRVAQGVLHGGMASIEPTTETGVSLGNFIRDRRVALDITKSDAARRAGVSRRTWHEVEEGTRATSTAVTLACFDQALQLPEGTLYAMTARSASQQVETLRHRAIELVRAMTTSELEAFVESNGAQTVRGMFEQLRADIAELRDAPPTPAAPRSRQR